MLSSERENVLASDAKKSNELDVEADHAEQQDRKCWILDES
jgi:hypothetical protein